MLEDLQRLERAERERLGVIRYRSAPRPTLLGSIWCALFHGRHTSQRTAAGDWRQMYCRKCSVTWPEPQP